MKKNEDFESLRSKRYKLLGVASSVLLKFYGSTPPTKINGFKRRHRTCDCHRATLTSSVQVMFSKNHSKSFFGSVVQCGCVWTCPVCSAKISNRKGDEIRLAITQAKVLGLNSSLVTFTSPHTAGDSIDDLVKKMNKALSGWWRGSPATRFKQRYGIVGHIRAFEVRYGINGWHPHFHILIFSGFKLPSTNKLLSLEFQDEDWVWMFKRWVKMATTAGLKTPNMYGMDVQTGDKAGQYITKFGSDGDLLTSRNRQVTWDFADEITKGNIKSGKKGSGSLSSSLSPWDILECISDSRSRKDRFHFENLFLDYSRAMKGVSQVRWSRGLRSFFVLGPEKSDSEIVSENSDVARILCTLTIEEWRYLIMNEYRATVLQLAENGGSEAVARFLYSSLYNKNGDFDSFDSFFLTFLNR